MTDNKSQEPVFRLSSLDQAATRVYHRYALCFECPWTLDDIDTVAKKLNATVKRTVSQLPILAGRVRPALVEDGQFNRLEVAVTLDDVHHSEAIASNLSQQEFGQVYNVLTTARVPPAFFVNEKLTPLPDTPNPESAPVFAVQGSFIPGGLIVAIYLHNSVADTVGLGTVISHLSSDLPSCKLTDDELGEESVEQSRLRDRLSGSRGIKADIRMDMNPDTMLESALVDANLSRTSAGCRILSFNLNLLIGVKDLANEHLHDIDNDRSYTLTIFEVLTAVLWKGISRARVVAKASPEDELQYESSLFMPVDIRTTIEPHLDDSYLGNAEYLAISTLPALKLYAPFDAATISKTARILHHEIMKATEPRVRSTIAGINISADVQDATDPKFNPEKDLWIKTWADLPLEQAHLGLDLGAPGWVRKVGREQMADGCIVHPIRQDEGLVEVTVELDEKIIEALLKDDNFMSFLVHVV